MTSDAAFEALLEFLKRTRGLDFTGYKRSSLERRFRRRMEHVGCEGFGDYLDHLQVDPDEYAQLFDMLLINVTEFFRDPPAWEHLAQDVLPALLEAKADDEPLRVWSAGCAGGQEAYTIAMVLVELLGDEAYRERVKIYATDIDEDALSDARLALYSAKQVESVPEALRGEVLRAGRSAVRVPQGAAAHGDLRAQQPRAGRADLAPGPAGLPQHADVLQRGDAVADPAPLPLRAQPAAAR